MTYAAKILADSVSPDGVRLTTMQVTFPRIVLAEFNTHRVFSRNSASSRAIPVKKMIERVMETPYIPSSWGRNQKGMQAEEELTEDQKRMARVRWLAARDDAVMNAKNLLKVGLHKQLTNRLLEPFLWHTCIVTATEWSNFFNLRCNPLAHPDIRIPAEMMRDVMKKNESEPIDYGEWHLPFIGPEDYDLAFVETELGYGTIRGDSQTLMKLMAKVSCARCARVSYLTHEGKRDLEADLKLCDRLLEAGHMSPFEHAARPAKVKEDVPSSTVKAEVPLREGELEITGADLWFGNLRGWCQYRKTIPHEEDVHGHG